MSITLKYNPASEKRVLAEFCNGIPENGTKFVCKAYQEKRQNDPKLKNRKMLFVKGKYVDYIGDNFSSQQLAHPYARKYVLAKLDRKTGTAEVFDTDLFKLRPIASSDASNKTAAPREEEKETYARKDEQLAMLFGTSAIKASKLASNRAILSEKSIADEVEDIVKNQDFKVIDDDFSLSTQLLPFNKSAQSVEEVYALFDIIPYSDFYAISDAAEKFFGPALEDFETWEKEAGKDVCQYLREHIQNPGEEIVGDEDLRNKYLTILLFIRILIKIVTCRQKTYTAKSRVFLGLSERARSYFTSAFFDVSGKVMVRPDSLKDKAIATAIILAWHLDSFSVDCDLLRTTFDLTIAKFSLIVRALGGTIKDDRAKLSLPLKFPREYSVQRRMKRLLK